MPLKQGTRLGQYEIVDALGAGGMGEVYRARDTALQRDVAIKILPDLFADDPERLARFSREAQTLAALNHPNIAHIYGLEGTALVMELVEGLTLAEIIAGPAAPSRRMHQSSGPSDSEAWQAVGVGPHRGLSIEDVLPQVRQIAEALEAAHERGIIHRDLKPANIKVRPDGVVKVLDFGLAKALETPGTNVGPASGVGATLTSPAAMTHAGMILGTAAYMSPEQAKGRSVDKRSDIWAFGCVLFEMLTGRMAFAGDSVTDTLAAVVRGEPDWGALPADTPASINRLLRRCLTKDVRERLSDIGVARLEIRDATDRSEPAGQPPASRGRILGAWWLAPAALLVGVLATGLGAWLLRPVPPVFPPLSLAIDWPDDLTWTGLAGSGIAISPDGTHVAYTALAADESRRLYLRTLTDDSSRAVPGSDRAYGPFFSPDSAQLGFVLSGKLWRVAVGGGTPFEIGIADPDDRGWAWSPDGYIYSGGGSGVSRIAETGGPRESITAVDRAAGEVAHRFPALVSGGRGILFTIFKGSLDDARIAVLDLRTRKWRVLTDRPGSSAQYLPTGHVVYLRAGVLMAAPFDASRLEITGPQTPVMNGVAYNNGGAGHFGVAGTGTLVYVPDSASRTPTALMWADRAGRTTPIDIPPDPYRRPAISPDGNRVALEREDASSKSSVVIWDFGRKALTPVTRDSARNESPIWLPTGASLIFTSRPQPGSVGRLFQQRVDGMGNPMQISKATVEQVTGNAAEFPGSVSHDGTKLFYAQGSTTSDGLKTLDLVNSRVEVLVPSRVTDPKISPDGRWLAYASPESGISEIYLRPYPDVNSARWLVSNGSGRSPRWSRDGRELFYVGLGVNSSRLFAVTVESSAAMGTVQPQLLFEIPQVLVEFDVASDGRFLLVTVNPSKRPIPHVIVNWFEALKRTVSAQRAPQ